jgi:hypothetical protein
VRVKRFFKSKKGKAQKNVQILTSRHQDSWSIMEHVNALAYMKYTGFKYEWRSKSLEQLLYENKNFDIGSNRLEEIETVRLSPRLVNWLFEICSQIKLRIGAEILNLFAISINCKLKIDSTQVNSIVKRNTFLYENLANWDLYGVRSINTKIVKVNLDLRNYSGITSLSVLMKTVNPHIRALEYLWSGGMFSSNKKLVLEVIIKASDTANFSKLKPRKKAGYFASSTHEFVIKISNELSDSRTLNKITKSDIQILPKNPTDLSLAAAILHPRKVVMVDGRSTLKLRNWTVY